MRKLLEADTTLKEILEFVLRLRDKAFFHRIGLFIKGWNGLDDCWNLGLQHVMKKWKNGIKER